MDLRAARQPLAWATTAPLLCAAHCMATPLLVVVAPSLAANSGLEFGLLTVTMGLAAAVLVAGVRAHRQGWIVLPTALGIALWSASLLGAMQPLPEPITTAAASLLVAAALFWNERLRHRAVCATCAQHLVRADLLSSPRKRGPSESLPD